MSKPTKIHAVVECKIHGKQSDLYEGTMVKVNNIISTKKQKEQVVLFVIKKNNKTIKQ